MKSVKERICYFLGTPNLSEEVKNIFLGRVLSNEDGLNFLSLMDSQYVFQCFVCDTQRSEFDKAFSMGLSHEVMDCWYEFFDVYSNKILSQLKKEKKFSFFYSFIDFHLSLRIKISNADLDSRADDVKEEYAPKSEEIFNELIEYLENFISNESELFPNKQAFRLFFMALVLFDIEIFNENEFEDFFNENSGILSSLLSA